MYRLFANGTVNAAVVGYGPPLFLFHSLLADRASFDAVAPALSRSYRLIIPELPGFGRSQAVSGGLAAVADRMAEAVADAAAMLRKASRPGSENAAPQSARINRDAMPGWRIAICSATKPP